MKTPLVLVCLMWLAATAVRAQELADGPGKDAVIKNCTTCHAADPIIKSRHTKAEWQSVIELMIGYGADISDTDVEVIATYLVTHYGKSTSVVAASVVAGAVSRPASEVWDGVYTEAQARRGAIVYLDHCAECHAEDLSGKTAYNASPSLVGPEFRTRWDAKTLEDLFELIRTRMPKRREGALKTEEYVDLVAFVLQANRFPASTAELSADPEALRRVGFLKERPR